MWGGKKNQRKGPATATDTLHQAKEKDLFKENLKPGLLGKKF